MVRGEAGSSSFGRECSGELCVFWSGIVVIVSGGYFVSFGQTDTLCLLDATVPQRLATTTYVRI